MKVCRVDHVKNPCFLVCNLVSIHPGFTPVLHRFYMKYSGMPPQFSPVLCCFYWPRFHTTWTPGQGHYNKVGGNLFTGSSFGFAPSTMHNNSSIESCLIQYLCPQVAKALLDYTESETGFWIWTVCLHTVWVKPNLVLRIRETAAWSRFTGFKMASVGGKCMFTTLLILFIMH